MRLRKAYPENRGGATKKRRKPLDNIFNIIYPSVVKEVVTKIFMPL